MLANEKCLMSKVSQCLQYVYDIGSRTFLMLHFLWPIVSGDKNQVQRVCQLCTIFLRYVVGSNFICLANGKRPLVPSSTPSIGQEGTCTFVLPRPSQDVFLLPHIP